MSERPKTNPPAELPRVMGLRDVVLFNITAIVGLRWLTTAASQFGVAALPLWLFAMLVFFIPSALAVRELADVDPGAGGLYRWASRAFGARQGFLAGWGYWVNNLFYYPSLMVATAAIAAYIGGPRFVHLGDNPIFIAVVALVGLWIAVALNIVGLNIGKWLQNVGGFSTWVPALIFIILAAWVVVAHGSATRFTAAGLVPARVDFQSINLFATMTFAYAGLELAPSLGGEIHDPAATLRRGVLLSGVGIVVIYVLGTVAMLVALPHETVSITNGMPQATAVLIDRLGLPGLGWIAAVVAALLAISNVGGVGAWLAGSARLPYVAGLGGALPAAFARVHPRWRTPYLSLLVQGFLATVFVVSSLVGTSVTNAYLILTQTTLILYFIPYLYIFAAYLKLRRQRSAATALVGVLGLASVAFSIVLGFVVPPGEAHPWWYEAKVAGGVAVFIALGWWLAPVAPSPAAAERRAA